MKKIKCNLCVDCKLIKFPMFKSMFDDQWRCTNCNHKFINEYDTKFSDNGEIEILLNQNWNKISDLEKQGKKD